MQSDQQHGYRNRFLTRWLPLYLLIGGVVYLIVYFAFINGGGGGGGGY
jgi:hypothetical protein